MTRNRLLAATAALLVARAVAAPVGAASDPRALVPAGYRVVETIRGDLDRDGREDVVLLVKATDPAGIVDDERGGKVDRNRRGLVIAFRHGDRYDLALKNLACFSSENEDGGVYFAPELSVSVMKNGTLSLHYSHGRYGYWIYKFRWQQGAFELIGYDGSSDDGPVVERFTSINLLSNKAVTRTNTNPDAQGGDERFEETWKTIAPHAPIRLADIQDFDGLNVEAELHL